MLISSLVEEQKELWVSPSRLRAFKECPKKYDYVYRQGLNPKGRKLHFDKGNYTHELMHVYYQLMQETGRQPGDDFLVSAILTRIRNDIEQHTTADNVEVYNSVMRLVSRYIVVQSPKIDINLQVRGIESELKILLGTFGDYVVYLYGYVDLVYQTLRGLYVVRDHKTGSNPRAWNQNVVETDDQLLAYGAILYKLVGMAPRVEINFCSTYDYKNKPSPNQFSLYHHNHTEETYQNYLDEVSQLVEDMISSRPTPHRSRNCVNCPFYQPCTLEGLRGVSVENILKNNYEVIDRNGPTRPKAFTENNTEENNGNL